MLYRVGAHVLALQGDDDMPKSKAFYHCVDIMRFLIEADFRLEVHRDALAVAITAVRGGDPRTIKNWTETLVRLGFLERKTTSVRAYTAVYRMHVEEYPELLNALVKPGQIKLM